MGRGANGAKLVIRESSERSNKCRDCRNLLTIISDAYRPQVFFTELPELLQKSRQP